MANTNQCDGCLSKSPLSGFMHLDERGRPYMTCQAFRYQEKKEEIMPGNTAIHDTVTMERLMKAYGYEWDSPQGIAFRNGWHDKQLDKDKWFDIQIGAMKVENEKLNDRLKIEEAINEGLKLRIQQLQAQIDSLMLEYCPKEMTQEQLENWAKHQKRADDCGNTIGG